MTHASHYQRILRRESHSPRSGLAIVLAVILILVFLWIGTEGVLALVSQQALLVAPTDALAAVTALPEAADPTALIGAGVVIALIGLVLSLFAVLPGHRARHTGEVTRTAAVVDNTVIASALARTASVAANVDRDQVTVTIGHRTADVTVRPTSGFPVDKDAVAEAVGHQITIFRLTPALRSSVTIENRGVVGA